MARLLHSREAEETDAAGEEDWGPHVEIADLPPFPGRGEGYYTEPWCGIVLVGVLSVVLVASVQGIAKDLDPTPRTWALAAIWTWAALALLCTAYIIFAGAGVVKRSTETCYPMPKEVVRRLMTSEPLTGLQNISCNVPGKPKGTYCVRCLVWRPPSRDGYSSHHCSTCSRCVTGFDHHCGVFGRCIVRGNMPCFNALVGMLFTSFGTLMVALYCSSPPEPSRSANFRL